MLNCISVSGRLVREPELRRTTAGKAVTSFTLACDRDFKNQQTGEKEVDFLDCVAWGASGENVAKYFRKGQMAMVTGRLQIRQYTDKSGQKRSRAEIVVASVYFCGGRENGAQANCEPDTAYPTQRNDYAMVEDEDAQLPF